MLAAARFNVSRVRRDLADPDLLASIRKAMTKNPADRFATCGECVEALMQASQMQSKHWNLFPVGIGLGTDYNFMDRLARMGATADDNGQSRRGSGNPAEYEQRLTEIFEEIINNPKVRLVQ